MSFSLPPVAWSYGYLLKYPMPNNSWIKGEMAFCYYKDIFQLLLLQLRDTTNTASTVGNKKLV